MQQLEMEYALRHLAERLSAQIMMQLAQLMQALQLLFGQQTEQSSVEQIKRLTKNSNLQPMAEAKNRSIRQPPHPSHHLVEQQTRLNHQLPRHLTKHPAQQLSRFIMGQIEKSAWSTLRMMRQLLEHTIQQPTGLLIELPMELRRRQPTHATQQLLNQELVLLRTQQPTLAKQHLQT